MEYDELKWNESFVSDLLASELKLGNTKDASKAINEFLGLQFSIVDIKLDSDYTRKILNEFKLNLKEGFFKRLFG